MFFYKTMMHYSFVNESIFWGINVSFGSCCAFHPSWWICVSCSFHPAAAVALAAAAVVAAAAVAVAAAGVDHLSCVESVSFLRLGLGMRVIVGMPFIY